MEYRLSRCAGVTVSLIFAGFIAGCGVLDLSNTSGSDTSALNAESQDKLIPVDDITVEKAQSGAKLGSLTDNGIDLSIAKVNGSQVIAINTGSNSSVVSTHRLSNPDRLVLDITDSQIQKSSTISVAENEIVSGIRIGAHDLENGRSKGRVVIDLKGQAAETVQQSGESILVAFNPPQILPTETEVIAQSSPIDTKLASQTDTQLDSAQIALDNSSNSNSGEIKAEEVLASNQSQQSVEPQAENIPVAKRGLGNVASNQVTELKIDTLPGQGSVAIATVTDLSDYDFKKTAPSEYIATIRGASLALEASQTLLAPPQSSGIRSVRPIEKNGDVILRIFAQPENDLAAVAKNNTLVIRSIDNNVDYMAQTKVEPSLPEDKTKSKTSEKADVKLAKGQKNSTPAASVGSDGSYTGALISLELQDADIDSALRIIAEVSNLNIIASSDVQGKVTLRLQNVPWDQALDVILKTNGLDKVQDGNVVRIAPVEKLRLEREALKQAQLAEDELEPLTIKYLRVSYARVDDIKPLIKSVLTERGDVTVDARSNQLIIKDIKRGLKEASELVSKLDLRTPQVLLETQIVESSRSFLRDLGSQLGFTFVQSPETGNATGWDFPNSVGVGGGIPNNTNASNFPASITGVDGGSAIALAFGSADGTKSLDANISALEREGLIKIISRPSVATTNNKPAEITSNETISVLMPNGGVSTVVGGQGAAGGPAVATEKIKAGITLKVTPQASPDYFILMDIQAESSNFGSRVVNGIPALFERRATSTVLVSSGQTFAIGGIYRTTDRDTIRGVPFLKDIPVLGNFFSGNTVDVQDEELLFFITPRIIEGSFDDAAMSTEGL